MVSHAKLAETYALQVGDFEGDGFHARTSGSAAEGRHHAGRLVGEVVAVV